MSSQGTSRSLALAALVRVEEGAWSNLVVPALLRPSALDARDRAFTTELVRGTLRWQLALDDLLQGVVSRPLAALDVPVRQALRLGAYQLVEAGVPAHAAVATTMAALDGHAGGRLVNGALRALARAGPPWSYSEDRVALAFPPWLRSRLTPDTMAALQRPAATHVRVRVGREQEADATIPDATRGRLVPAARRLSRGDPTPLVQGGLATVQDEASGAVGLVAGPRRDGVPIVDLCAAPGGKSTQLAENAPSSAVLAGDLHRGRARAVVSAGRRLGLPNLRVIAHDARAPAVGVLPEGAALLLDAPCTGLGTLRRRPEIRMRVDERRVAELASLQRDLARAAVALVPRHGSLVYSACTLTTEETLDVATVLLQDLEEEPVALPLGELPGGPPGPGGFLLPDMHDTDGMYLIRLRRT